MATPGSGTTWTCASSPRASDTPTARLLSSGVTTYARCNTRRSTLPLAAAAPAPSVVPAAAAAAWLAPLACSAVKNCSSCGGSGALCASTKGGCVNTGMAGGRAAAGTGCARPSTSTSPSCQVSATFAGRVACVPASRDRAEHPAACEPFVVPPQSRACCWP